MRLPRGAGFWALWALVIMMVRPSASGAADVACRLASEEMRRFERMGSGVVARIDLDYGSFRWLVLEHGERDRLAAEGIECRPEAAAAEIHIAGHSFDPLLRAGDWSPTKTSMTVPERGWLIVQFVGPARDDWLGWLDRAGMDPVQFIPSNAFLVWVGRAERTAVKRILEAPFVRWAGAAHCRPQNGKRHHARGQSDTGSVRGDGVRA